MLADDERVSIKKINKECCWWENARKKYKAIGVWGTNSTFRKLKFLKRNIFRFLLCYLLVPFDRSQLFGCCG